MPTYNDFQSRDSTAVGRNQEFQPQRDGGAQTQFTNMSYAEQQDSWQKMQKRITADSLPNVDVVFDQDAKLRDQHAMHRDRRDFPNQREQLDQDRRDTVPNQREQFERKMPPINPNKLDKPDQQEQCDDDKNHRTRPRRTQRHPHIRFVGE